MKIQKVNKTTAAVLAGAAVAVIGAFVTLEPSVLAAVQMLLTAGLVWVVPNGA